MCEAAAFPMLGGCTAALGGLRSPGALRAVSGVCNRRSPWAHGCEHNLPPSSATVPPGCDSPGRQTGKRISPSGGTEKPPEREKPGSHQGRDPRSHRCSAEGRQLCKTQSCPALGAAALTSPRPPGADAEAVGAEGETAPCPSPAINGGCRGVLLRGPQQLWAPGTGTRCLRDRACSARWGGGERAPGSAGCTQASASPGTHAPLLYCKHLSSMAACLF